MLSILPAEQLAQTPDIPGGLRQINAKPINAPLYVITVIQNSQRYFVRYKLYHAFERFMEYSGAQLYTVELALRDRHFEITQPNHPRHIQLRSPHTLWHKENLLNIAIRHLPQDWQYVAWIDADILFARQDWVYETLHQLQHHPVVQLFSQAIDLDPNYNFLTKFNGFAYSYVTGAPEPKRVASKVRKSYYLHGADQWHPGYAWAIRRSALSDLGGFGDIGILGSGDHHIACAIIGKVNESIHGGMPASYKEYWLAYQERAIAAINYNLGFVSGTICHYWHGKKENRKYIDRWQILINNQFDYLVDLQTDVQGLYSLTAKKPKLRDAIQQYFAARNEDSIDVK